MGYPPGAVLELLFGDKAYVGVEGWATRPRRAAQTPAATRSTHDWHRMEIGEITLEDWFDGRPGPGARGARPADRHGRVPHVHGRDAGRRALAGRAQGPRAPGRRRPDRAAHEQREGVGRPLAGDVPGRRAVRDRRRLERGRDAQARPARSTSSRASGSASRPTRRCSSTTTRRTSPRPGRSAWRRCTSARTRSSPSPSSTRSSTAAASHPAASAR